MKPTCIALAAWLLVSPAAADDVSQTALITGDLVYDRNTRRIYASRPFTEEGGDSIASIDPFAREVRAEVFVGSLPGKLALSDNGEYLYAVLEDGRAVRRVHVPSQTAGMQFRLGTDVSQRPHVVTDLAVLPERPESVAVARRVYSSGSPPHRDVGVQIYDDGIPRFAESPAAPLPQAGSRIEFGHTAARLYAYFDDPGASPVFRRLAIGPTGITTLSRTGGLITGDTEIRFDDGFLYTSNGLVIDPETSTLVGTFPGVPAGSLVVPDAASGRVFFLFPGSSTRRWIVAYDRHTFLQAGVLAVHGVNGAAGSLIRWGEDGLAFRTNRGQLFLIRTALVAPSAAGVRARIAVYRPVTGQWFLRGDDGTATTVAFGGPGDQPVPADYLGVGRPQLAVFRPRTQEWFIRTPMGETTPFQFGGAGDVPVPADYLGLGRAQIAVFRPRTREWFLRMEDGRATRVPFGGPGDVPVPGDYMGLGRAQIAVFRPDTAEWFIRKDDGESLRIQWGAAGDRPVPADYRGLGRTQIAVFRSITGEWFLRDDLAQATRVAFGASGDVPLPADYRLTGRAQMALYRPSTREWFVRDDGGEVQRVEWGGPGDLPVPAPYEHRFGIEVP